MFFIDIKYAMNKIIEKILVTEKSIYKIIVITMHTYLQIL